MTWPESVGAGFIGGCFIGGFTALMIALVMKTFSIGELPDWSLGIWFLWSLAWAIGIACYAKGKDW